MYLFTCMPLCSVTWTDQYVTLMFAIFFYPAPGWLLGAVWGHLLPRRLLPAPPGRPEVCHLLQGGQEEMRTIQDFSQTCVCEDRNHITKAVILNKREVVPREMWCALFRYASFSSVFKTTNTTFQAQLLWLITQSEWKSMLINTGVVDLRTVLYRWCIWYCSCTSVCNSKL